MKIPSFELGLLVCVFLIAFVMAQPNQEQQEHNADIEWCTRTKQLASAD